MSLRHIVVTGCDANHFELAEDLLASLRSVSGKKRDLGFVRFCSTPVPQAIADSVDRVAECSEGHGSFNAEQGYYCAYAAIKPRLPELFPGYDVYSWIDADCWLQNDVTLDRFERAATEFDLSIHPECDVHYLNFPTPSFRTFDVYRRAMPKELKPGILHFPMLNAGIVSARRESPIWRMWKQELTELRARVERGESDYYCDQVPLHHLIHSRNVQYYPLRAVDNWQTYAAIPRVDFTRRRLMTPTPPHETINIVHLASNTKDRVFNLPNGMKLRLRRRELLAAFDENSASLARIKKGQGR